MILKFDCLTVDFDQCANFVLVDPNLTQLTQVTTRECADSLSAADKLAQLTVSSDIGHQEVDAHGLPILAVAQHDGGTTAEVATMPLQ